MASPLSSNMSVYGLDTLYDQLGQLLGITYTTGDMRLDIMRLMQKTLREMDARIEERILAWLKEED